MPLRRDRLTSEVGPDGSGSKPGIECAQMPEKSGMDAALWLPLLAGPTITACPQAAAAASVTTKRKSHRCKFMLSSLFRAQPGDHKGRPHSGYVEERRSVWRGRGPLPQRILLKHKTTVRIVFGCRIRTSSFRKGELL